MQDLKHLESLNATPEHFRSLYEKKQLPEKLKKLSELHADRLRRAISTNLEEAPIYGAIDKGLQAAQDNLPYLQARQLANSGKTTEEIQKFFKSFGLENMLEPVFALDSAGKPVAKLNSEQKPLLTFNQPLFETVFVPLVFAYCEMRIAKLYNDRNQYPRYKYAPPRLTQKDMVTADIVTDRIQRMVADMGYADDDKQSIRQMSYYGICFNFPQEAWHKEQYDTKDGETVKTKTKRCGVRFAIPHPSRQFCDRSQPLYRVNSDTGPSYMGYWDIHKWGDIKGNSLYWNTDKITYGGYDLFTSDTWRIFQTYYPCVISMPKGWENFKSLSEKDRIAKEQSNYLKNENDASITLAVLFDKIIPKDWGLFDYDKPVWMRFIYANFECCVHCEVLPYTPGYVYLDRYDANRTVAQSMGLQLSPFAQLLGNFLTQHFQSVKQNLFRVAWVNTDIMPADQISLLKRMKDKALQGINWLLYSKKHNSFQIGDRGDQREAVTPMQNLQVDTQQLRSNVELTLSVIERVLGISPQEVGQAASHEQSAGEVNIIAGSTSNSLEFMGTGIDSAWQAKKRLLYTAFFCYDDDEVFAEVADLTPERKKALEDLGFAIEEGSEGPTHAGVKGKKAALVMDSFLSDREGVTRLNDSKVGIAMLQMLGQFSANPVFIQAIGVKKFVELSMQVWKMVGLPSDFTVDVKNIEAMDPQQQQQQMAQLMAQLKDQIVKESVTIAGQQTEQLLQQQVVEPITKEFMQVVEQIKQLQANDQQLLQAGQELKAENQVIEEAIKRIMPVVEVMESAATQQMPPVAPPPQVLPPEPEIPPNAIVPVGPQDPTLAPVG